MSGIFCVWSNPILSGAAAWAIGGEAAMALHLPELYAQRPKHYYVLMLSDGQMWETEYWFKSGAIEPRQQAIKVAIALTEKEIELDNDMA